MARSRRQLLASAIVISGEGAPAAQICRGPCVVWRNGHRPLTRDRATLVPEAAHAKELWPVLGRPGAVLVDGELVGTWRPRKSGSRLTVAVRPWEKLPDGRRRAVVEQAEQLAAYRSVALAGVPGEAGVREDFDGWRRIEPAQRRPTTDDRGFDEADEVHDTGGRSHSRRMGEAESALGVPRGSNQQRRRLSPRCYGGGPRGSSSHVPAA
ncbi:crosslink repair DNA glycosylase YcaQ family protein [Micromonospora sp. KC606]|uniref:DNA glycosylase AlkZ-like family protein n=1 Tax=Micromonospora sp. KC606 TaxID=2530379 RepID=UPI001A9F5F5F|nr:crosslink repair DNA glycosylase YcaQ family protein [Micromonospora sp. KC606]